MVYDKKKRIEQTHLPPRRVGQVIEIVDGKNQRIICVSDCEATTDTGGLGGAWTGGAPSGGTGPTMTAGVSNKRTGTNCIKAAWDNTSVNTYALFTLTTPYDFRKFSYFGFWASHDSSGNGEWDGAADFTVQLYNAAGNKLYEWTNPAATEYLNAFRVEGDIPHCFELPLTSTYIQSGYSLDAVKSIRFVATTTEKENASSLYIDRIELYQWGTGAGPLRYGKVKCFEFSADVDRGTPCGVAADEVLGTLRLGQDNDTTIRGVTAESVSYGTEPNCWVIIEGVVNLITQEVISAGEGAVMHGTASNTIGYDVDDGGASAIPGAVFAKLDQQSTIKGQHPARLLTGYGTYAV